MVALTPEQTCLGLAIRVAFVWLHPLGSPEGLMAPLENGWTRELTATRRGFCRMVMEEEEGRSRKSSPLLFHGSPTRSEKGGGLPLNTVGCRTFRLCAELS